MMLSKSISNSAQYVILHSKIRRKESRMCRFGSGKRIFGHFGVAGTKACMCRKECNKCDIIDAQVVCY